MRIEAASYGAKGVSVETDDVIAFHVHYMNRNKIIFAFQNKPAIFWTFETPMAARLAENSIAKAFPEEDGGNNVA